MATSNSINLKMNRNDRIDTPVEPVLAFAAEPSRTREIVLPRRTPLYSLHRELGARIVDFAGWEMPVDYGGVVAEHMSVREEAGLFDVSHMGEFFVEGSDAEAFLQRLTPNDVSRLAIGQAQYSALTTERGTFVDDILVYRLDERRYLLVVNAANIEKDFSWIESRKTGDVSLRDESDRYALLALQGPRAAALLEPLTDVDLGSMKYYRFARGKVLDEESLVSRTGYTGEDGFEIMLEASGAERVARGLLGRGVAPVGLAARDTLRLEAKMALYGNDIDEEHTVLEADLGWIIKWQKGDFTGREALERQKERGVTRRLVGFEMIDRGIARHGHRVFVGGKSAETVTSGSFAPYLKKNIGLTYLPVESCEEGTEIEIDIRGRRAGARVAPTPFYKRGMKSA